jgi:HEAT repeat protein
VKAKLIAAALACAVAGGGIVLFTHRSSSPVARTPMTATAPATPPARTSDRVAQRRAALDDVAGQPNAASTLRASWDATSDGAERVRILEAVGHIPDPSGLAMLVEIAARQDEPLAAQAAAAIGSMNNPKLAPDLARLAADPEASPLVRANAARALTLSGSKDQAAVLSALVKDASQPPRVRQEAALSLGRIGDANSAVVLGQTLDALASDPTDSAVQLRISIVQGLAGIAAPAAHEALVRHRARSLTSVELAFVERALRAQPAG